MQNCSKLMTPAAWMLAAVMLTVYGSATAQYVWLDDNGIKQLSDRPPPPSVPPSRILKLPRLSSGSSAVLGNPSEHGAALPVPGNPAIPPGPATTADREADFQQRRTAAAAAENKAAGEARDRAAQAANCNAARQNQRALEGGGGIVHYDEQGERSVMDDRQREELAKNTQKVLASCK